MSGIEFSVVDEVRDVHEIMNPAYVVKQGKDGKGGCIVSWNREFEKLSNFKPVEVDKNLCHVLFGGYQRQQGNYVQVCKEDCVVRTTPIAATVLREIWIKSKLPSGESVRRSVDVYIFPFESRGSRYALHVLIDRGGVHDNDYFEESIAKIKTAKA